VDDSRILGTLAGSGFKQAHSRTRHPCPVSSSG
jgi:hypothetical protein